MSAKPLSAVAPQLAAALRRVTPYHDLLPLSAVAEIRAALRAYDEAVAQLGPHRQEQTGESR